MSKGAVHWIICGRDFKIVLAHFLLSDRINNQHCPGNHQHLLYVHPPYDPMFVIQTQEIFTGDRSYLNGPLTVCLNMAN